jgi:sugar phosphate isomerase/epimerase
MKFAICNETFVDWPLPRAIVFAAACGYAGLEFAPFSLGAFASQISQSDRRDVVRLLNAAGMETVGLHWLLARTTGFHLTSPDPVVRRRTGDYLGELARLCRDLGGRLMVLGSPQQRNLAEGVTDAEGIGYATDVIQAALPVLEETGVILAVEPLGPAEGNFLLTAADGIRLIQMVDSPHCRLHLDCKAMSSEATPIPDLLRRHREHLVHFHANDPNRQGPGFGELRFEPILAALDEIGYNGWVSVEVFDYSPGVEHLARQSIEYLRGCLDNVHNAAKSNEY